MLLFDLDGTLTEPRKPATSETLAWLRSLRTKTTLGLVGGSDLVKMREQLTVDPVDLFDYVFAENGLVAIVKGVPEPPTRLDSTDPARLKDLIESCLREVLAANVPVRRGTFIEFRSGMLNVSPIGRNCSQAERDAFEEYDREHGVRAEMIERLSSAFPEFTFSIGGQISFDVVPRGWDKTFCLRYLSEDKIHFWGDKTHPGGNDAELFQHPRVQGHRTTSAIDTRLQVDQMFGSF